jgi:hypothetical protein
MRTIDSAASSVLSGNLVPIVLLVEMLMSEPVRLCSSSMNIVYDGAAYLGIGDLGTVEEVDDSPGEYKALRFALNGVRNDYLAIVLAENIRDKPCTLRMAVLDPITHVVLDAPVVWTGTLDQMPLTIGTETSTISVTAEHRGATYARPKPLRYIDSDQQLLYPGDTSMRFVESQSNHQDVWPAASFFKI